MTQTIRFIIAENSNHFEDAKNLFIEYSNSLSIDLSFQDFENELKSITVQYSKPNGALILVFVNDSAIACAGIRKLDDETAELKRMFVRLEYRGQNIAQQMLVMAIDLAKKMNYKRIRLDTLPSMKAAQKLYTAFGFYEIPAYRYNPVDGTVFMEKKLED